MTKRLSNDRSNGGSIKTTFNVPVKIACSSPLSCQSPNKHGSCDKLPKQEEYEEEEEDESQFLNAIQCITHPNMSSLQRERLVSLIGEIENRQTDFVEVQLQKIRSKRQSYIDNCRKMADDIQNLKVEDAGLNRRMDEAKRNAELEYLELKSSADKIYKDTSHVLNTIDNLVEKKTSVQKRIPDLSGETSSLTRRVKYLKKEKARLSKEADDLDTWLASKEEKLRHTRQFIFTTISQYEVCKDSLAYIKNELDICLIMRKSLSIRLIQTLDAVRDQEELLDKYESYIVPRVLESK